MPATTFRGRRAAAIENEQLKVTVTREGGHVAEILHKGSGVNPLWIPIWPSIEPSTFSKATHPEYGGDPENRLLAGIMGHSLCLDIFGGPSAEEYAAGLDVHGDASIASFDIEESGNALRMRTKFPLSGIQFERRIELHGSNVKFVEIVESLLSIDRPIGWTQHVTLGPPFVERGKTQLRASAGKSKVFDGQFSPADKLEEGAEFDWPHAPQKHGGTRDLRVYTNDEVSGGYTAHFMSPYHENAFFAAFSPALKVAVGYVWKKADFPWMGIWEEHCSRPMIPWNGKTLTWAMEFGVSPFPESRRQMVDRGSLFGVPGCRWLPAKGCLQAEYWATVRSAESVPGSVAWPGEA